MFCLFTVSSQNIIEIHGVLNTETNTLLVKQKITYYNNSNSSLSELYFNDWSSSFSSPDSPLSQRFVEEYNGSLLNPKQKHVMAFLRGERRASLVFVGVCFGG